MTLITKQSGIALIQVIFVIALLATVVSVIQVDNRREIVRTYQKLAQYQAHEYLMSGETIAIQGLWLDKNFNNIDHLEEDWAQIFGPLPLDAGQEGKILPGLISVQITDLNSLFDLNGLANQDSKGAEFQTAFENLLLAENIEPVIALNLKQWFDKDSGAEYLYMNKQTPFQPSLRPMVDASELKRIEGMSERSFRTIEMLVTTLPSIEQYNLNTINKKVLSALIPGIPSDVIEKIISNRVGEAYTSVSNMFQRIGLSKEQQKLFPDELFKVTSDYFKINCMVTLAGNQYYQSSVVRRTLDNKITVLSRTFSPFEFKEAE